MREEHARAVMSRHLSAEALDHHAESALRDALALLVPDLSTEAREELRFARPSEASDSHPCDDVDACSLLDDDRVSAVEAREERQVAEGVMVAADDDDGRKIRDELEPISERCTLARGALALEYVPRVEDEIDASLTHIIRDPPMDAHALLEAARLVKVRVRDDGDARHQ